MRRNLMVDFMVGNMAARWCHGDQRERDAVKNEISLAPLAARHGLMYQVENKLMALGSPAGRAAFHQHVVLPLSREES